jgi:hypothetical protein
LDSSQEVDGDCVLVHFMEVVHRKSLICEAHLLSHTHVLRELLRNFLRNDATYGDIANSADLLPLLSVAILLHLQALKLLQDCILINICDLGLDSHI